MKKVAIITIGQTPRIDLTPDLIQVLDSDKAIVEYGALDSLSLEQIESSYEVLDGDELLVSRMRDGKEVKITNRFIIPRIQSLIIQAENDGCDATILCCTGVFPEFEHNKILIEPQRIIHSLSLNICQDKKIGICVPTEKQISQAYTFWNKSGVSVKVIHASPYNEEFAIGDRTRDAFSNDDLAFICLDCIGYSTKMKKDVEEKTGLPVLLPRTMVATILNDIL